MATDIEQLIRESTTAILTASSTIQALCGRATRIVVERDGLSQNTQLPIIAFDVLSYDEGNERAQLLFTAIADGTNAGNTARALLEACKVALTSPAYEAQGLNYIAPMEGVRQSVNEAEDIRGLLNLEDITLTQADWSLPLLVLT